jgi:hypothetical protein
LTKIYCGNTVCSVKPKKSPVLRLNKKKEIDVKLNEEITAKNNRMDKKQWKTLVSINSFAAIIIILPFLPGPSALSELLNSCFNILQIIGFLGILLIPIGVIWTLKLTIQKQKKQSITTITPILLWTIPIILLIQSIWIADYMRTFSRTFAIKNAENLIIAINKFRSANNKYPDSLAELTPIYLQNIPTPRIMGIPKFNYSNLGEDFTISFSQNVLIGFNYEIVTYNPSNKNIIEGELTTLYDTGEKYWKYYIYD